uniref:Uncharacterized protein n=1 Tax=uncultured crenarchaeote TaxID=29281 RepID=Q701W3_9CREN|nr:hypothetical protein [uncultured crenarchaeote]
MSRYMMIKKISAVCFLICFSYTILVIMPTLRESGFGFLEGQALWNNSNITVANSTQISTNGTAGNSTQILKTVQITSADSKAPTDGNSVNIDLQIQPFPITKNVDSQFMISFLQPSSQAVQVHVDYDFAITNNNNEVFRASSIIGQPLLHTAEGIVKIPYKFTQDGQYSLQVSVMGINFIPIKTEKALFDLNVS